MSKAYREIYISCDIEADGPIPGVNSMLSMGFAVAGYHTGAAFVSIPPTTHTFYRELCPIGEEFVAEALAVSGLNRKMLLSDGAEPAVAMAELVEWIHAVSQGARPVFVAYPLSFDWIFVYWYLIRFLGKSPFGHSSCLDMKTLYATKAGVRIGQAVKRQMPRQILPKRRHTHHALDDALEQAELFVNLMHWQPDPTPNLAR